MGLFRGKDDHDRTVADAPDLRRAAQGHPVRHDAASGVQVVAAPSRPPHAAEVSVVPVVQGAPQQPQQTQQGGKFGIEDAITLLKQIPHKDNETVRAAVHMTLAAMHIDRARLAESAANKDANLLGRIEKLRAEVERHNALALAATKEIAQLESERAEVGAARSWLVESPVDPQPSPIPLDRLVRQH
jgi:hypothetical protein